MAEITCLSCGATIADEAQFCARCGTPRPDAAAPPSADPVAYTPTHGPDFTLEAGALGLLGRSFVMGLGMLLVVPAPWIICWWYEWLYSEIGGRKGAALMFRGTPGSVWILTTIYGVVIWGNGIRGAVQEQGSSSTVADILVQVLSLVLGWALLRWAINHSELDDSRLNFYGGLLPYVGWSILLWLSFFTIIGWAWVMVLMYAWIFSKISGAPGKFHLLAKGQQILWRSIVMMLPVVPLLIAVGLGAAGGEQPSPAAAGAVLVGFLPMLALPWTLRWYLAWLIEQIHYHEAEPAVTTS